MSPNTIRTTLTLEGIEVSHCHLDGYTVARSGKDRFSYFSKHKSIISPLLDDVRYIMNKITDKGSSSDVGAIILRAYEICEDNTELMIIEVCNPHYPLVYIKYHPDMLLTVNHGIEILGSYLNGANIFCSNVAGIDLKESNFDTIAYVVSVLDAISARANN